ncbi:hypothetical protein pipiens_007067 [Culex pipiens pipiens]|uniref:Uncharacterized protein n=1 Tax=Culex pipiens pipiens TaxID=38569 RepID=A0ABD1DMA2_CULPP
MPQVADFSRCAVDGDAAEDGLERRPETKDVLSSGSASPSSTHSREGLATTTTGGQVGQVGASALLKRRPRRKPEVPLPTTVATATIHPEPPGRVDGVATSLIDSHDDVEHRIPATLIHDPSIER